MMISDTDVNDGDNVGQYLDDSHVIQDVSDDYYRRMNIASNRNDLINRNS